MSFNYYFYQNRTRFNILIANVAKKIDLKSINSQKNIMNISNKLKNDYEIFDRKYRINEEKIKKESFLGTRKSYFGHIFDNYENKDERNPLAVKIIDTAKKKNFISEFSKSREEILKLFEEFKNDSLVFDTEYRNQYENNYHFIQKEKQRQEILEACLEQYLYDSLTKRWINDYRDYLILTKKKNNKNCYSICYLFFLHSSIVKNLKSKDILHWQYPETLEDITFFKKDGTCWMWSITHEDIYEIVFQEKDKEEYEYLKSIGIEFVETEFTPTPEDYIHYLKEFINKEL